jgi:PBP1b-binding outer membrane lipoprotein LpoB
MKKRLISAIPFAVLSMLACNQPSAPAASEKPHNWVFGITPQTSIHAIDSVMMAWKKDSIALNFSKLEYDTLGKLTIVSGSVQFMAKGNLPSGKFTQDSISKKSLEIKLDDKPSVSLSDK